MSLIVKLITSLVIGIIAATLATLLRSGGMPDPLLLVAFCFATVATALIVGGPASAAQPDSSVAANKSQSTKPPAGGAAVASSDREQGQVKWFNVSKGFGFITKDDGEEIFVHFRSIRGEGRRGLRDGQRVTFVVAQSEKGPQAEDVEGID